jgi:hypothetical protein
MMLLSEMELKKLIQGGETNIVELKVAAGAAWKRYQVYAG